MRRAKLPLNVKARRGPEGLHLFDRKTGLNVLIDEVSIPAEKWDRAPRHVSIALTNACDLACNFCYAPKSAASLDPDVVTAWLRELDSNGCLGVGFGGGEPALYKWLPKLCEFAARQTSLAVSITSHGHRFNDELIGRLAGNVHYFRISMDGVWSTYESLRRRPFDLLLARIREIRRVAPFGINFVVNAMTVNDLDTAIAIANDLGAFELALLPEVPTAESPGIDARTRSALFTWVENYRGAIPLSINESDALGLPVCTPWPSADQLRGHAHIDAHGVLKRCSYDRVGVVVGHSGVVDALATLRRTMEKT